LRPYPADGRDGQELLEAADERLYRQKRKIEGDLRLRLEGVTGRGLSRAAKRADDGRKVSGVLEEAMAAAPAAPAA